MSDFSVVLPDNLPLFSGISQEKRKAMLTCLGARFRTVRKGEFLVLAQDEVNYIGIVLSSVLGGRLLDLGGASAALCLATVTGAAGMVIL